jgi:hypothetical protein
MGKSVEERNTLARVLRALLAIVFIRLRNIHSYMQYKYYIYLGYMLTTM